MPDPTTPSYLAPYRSALDRMGNKFEALLWASPKTQRIRFDALYMLQPMAGRTVLDVGCGRADLLDYLIARRSAPSHYVGIEAMDEFAQDARAKNHPEKIILQYDFLQDPSRMFVGAEIVVFSGSLNTLDRKEFYTTLGRAYDATAEVLVFNFLSSPELSGNNYLTWHSPSEVAAFCKSLGGSVEVSEKYLSGDCTIRVEKAHS